MKRKTQESFTIDDDKKEGKEIKEKRKSLETEQQKERPVKVERNISDYIKYGEDRAERVGKFLSARESARHSVDVANVRTDVPDTTHEKRKKKDYQAHEEEFEKRKTEIDTQIADLKKEEKTLARLYKEGPKDVREALSIKRDREGGTAPSGALGKLSDRLLCAFHGDDLQKEVRTLLQKESMGERETDTQAAIIRLQNKREDMFLPKTYNAEVDKIREEEKNFFLKHTQETSPRLAQFFGIDDKAVFEKLQDPSLKDSDLFSLMKDIGTAQAELIQRHHATDKACERTRSGYLLTRERKNSPKTKQIFY